MDEELSRKLQRKIVKEELPEFIKNPDKYVYSLHAALLTDFTYNCGIRNIEAEELEIYIGQEVKDFTREIDNARKKYVDVSNELMELYTNFNPKRSNTELIKKVGKVINDYHSFTFIISRYLLLMDFAVSSGFMAIKLPQNKSFYGEELITELFIYYLKICDEYVKLFDGNMSKSFEYLDKAREIVGEE